MPPRKRLRASAKDTPATTLPDDRLLEIVARTDAETIVRCAAACKPLRRHILSPGFIRRVCYERGGVMPACLSFLHAYDKARAEPRPPALFSLAHAATPAAASFSEKHIVRPLFRSAGADLLGCYKPLMFRGGLVALGRRHIRKRCRTDICVYDHMPGHRVFLPGPPDVRYVSFHLYVPLTAADGVGCSFILLAADFMQFRTSGSPSGSKSHRPPSTNGDPSPWQSILALRDCVSNHASCSAVVLGTMIHWLMYGVRRSVIITYGVGTTSVGSIELPADGLPNGCRTFNRHLTSSPEGKLRLLVSDRLTVSVWLQLSTGAGWERQAVIGAAAMVSSLVPELPEPWWHDRVIKFVGSGVRSGTVLRRPFKNHYQQESTDEDRFVLLDLETKQMQKVISRMNHIYIRSFPLRARPGLATIDHEKLLPFDVIHGRKTSAFATS